MLCIHEQIKFVQEYRKMKNLIFLSFLFCFTFVLAEEKQLNVAVPVESKTTQTNDTVVANLPRTDADFLKYSDYWKKQSNEALDNEIKKLQEFIITEGANARKTRVEYEKKYKAVVEKSDTEKIKELREKEKQLSEELSKVRQAIRDEIQNDTELKKALEINSRNNLNVRHARIALQGLQKIKNETR